MVPALEQIIQPGLADLNCNVYASLNLVGDVVSATSLEPTMLGSEPGWDRPVGNVDAAVASATATMVSPDGAILGIGLIDPSPVDAFPGQLVTKSGRTTGVTSSRVDATNVTMSVGYSDYPGGPQAFIREFYGQIVIKNRRNKFLAPGDSGSLAVEEGTLRPVALLFAGGNSIALANPAQDVLDYFDFDELTAQTRAAGAVADLSFVGTSGVGGSSVTQPSSLARAVEVQEANAASLRSVPGGVGHGVGLQNGVGVIKVFVEEITPAARQAVPSQIDGVPVVIEAVGRIVGF